MEQTTVTTQVLHAGEGMSLTQKADLPLEERTFGTNVYLAANDDPANWKEIPQEEADTLMEQQRLLIEERLRNPDPDKT